jgi:hypothetical protein
VRLAAGGTPETELSRGGCRRSLAAGTGLILSLLTSLLASQGPAGDSWSLRGNGALIVPFGLGPALIAAGWTAIVAHFRAQPRWTVLGAAARLVGLGLAIVSPLALVVPCHHAGMFAGTSS